jgi:hypothetical protein
VGFVEFFPSVSELGYRLNDRVQLSAGVMMEIFLFVTMSRPTLRPTQIHIKWVLRALTPGLKWLGCKADSSSPSGVMVKNV